MEEKKNVKMDVEAIATELVSFIYDYDLFEYRDACDREEDAVDQMIADLSDPDQIEKIVEHMREFAETIEEKEYRDRIEILINQIENIWSKLNRSVLSGFLFFTLIEKSFVIRFWMIINWILYGLKN